MPVKKPAGKPAKAKKPVARKASVRKAHSAPAKRPAKQAARRPAAARAKAAPARRAAARPTVRKHVAARPAAPKHAPAKSPAAKTPAPKAVPAKGAAAKTAPAPKTPAPAARAAATAKVATRPAAAIVKPALPQARPVALPSGRPATTPAAARPRPGAGTAVITTSRAQPRPGATDGEEDGVDGSLSLLAGPRNVKPYLAKKGELYMSKEQLEHFRTILLSWKRDLMEEVDRTVTHMKDEAANPPDPNDRATLESEFSLELRTRDRERKLIRKIDEALTRIEDGSYGYCLETGEEIGIKRLEARPVATLSIEAQERRERREKQYGDRDDRYR